MGVKLEALGTFFYKVVIGEKRKETLSTEQPTLRGIAFASCASGHTAGPVDVIVERPNGEPLYTQAINAAEQALGESIYNHRWTGCKDTLHYNIALPGHSYTSRNGGRWEILPKRGPKHEPIAPVDGGNTGMT